MARRVLSVTRAIERDLKTFPLDDRRSALAEAARVLARELDAPAACKECGAAVHGNSGQVKAQVARALRETLDRLRELAPPAKTDDRVDSLKDEFSRRRAARRATAADRGRS